MTHLTSPADAGPLPLPCLHMRGRRGHHELERAGMRAVRKSMSPSQWECALMSQWRRLVCRQFPVLGIFRWGSALECQVLELHDVAHVGRVPKSALPPAMRGLYGLVIIKDDESGKRSGRSHDFFKALDGDVVEPESVAAEHIRPGVLVRYFTPDLERSERSDLIRMW